MEEEGKREGGREGGRRQKKKGVFKEREQAHQQLREQSVAAVLHLNLCMYICVCCVCCFSPLSLSLFRTFLPVLTSGTSITTERRGEEVCVCVSGPHRHRYRFGYEFR